MLREGFGINRKPYILKREFIHYPKSFPPMRLNYKAGILVLTMFMATAAMATVHTVTVQNFFYSPSSLTINAGDTVRFQWVSGSHPTVSTSGDWVTPVFFPMNSGSPLATLVFPNPGTYNYLCDVHGGSGMVGSITVTGPPACSIASAPTGQAHTNLSNRVQLNWSPQSGAVACQVQGKSLPTGPQPSVNILAAPLNTSNVPYAVAGAGTSWTWRVRCACSITPLQVSPYTVYGDTFSIPLARESQLERSELIFPNPAQDQVQVSFETESSTTANLNIFDIAGQRMESRLVAVTEGANLVSIDVSKYQNGVYFLQIDQHEPLTFNVIR